MNLLQRIAISALALPLALSANFTAGQTLQVLPEQLRIEVRNPEQLSRTALPDVATPFTVASSSETRDEQRLSLDEAIQIAVRNAEVVRVLNGVSAVSSGRTIYDVSISNANIDAQTAIFDPSFDITTTINKTDRPDGGYDLLSGVFTGSSTDSNNTIIGLSKRNYNGASVGLNANGVNSYFSPGVPSYRTFAEITLRQPLARGYGRDVNLAPVVVARIDTERSYFQFKDSVQELVRGVIAAYWNLVAARINVWARSQQVEQADFAYARALERKAVGLDKAADVAQAKSALANFRATLITARSNLILTETALRNILGYPPSSTSVLVPTSTPIREQVDFNWDEILAMAELYRPDIIELKLVLEADQQTLLQADNQAKPQLDGIANYRWDGLSGEIPIGSLQRSNPGQFAGFNIGVNFSVPLGLRRDRSNLRRQELLLQRDQVNLDQGVHQMVHQLTINYRNLEQYFLLYVAYKEAREAALINYENQVGEVLSGRREFINALQAITDWGNAVSQEAASITQYNTELANVERQTGTILETHGIRFVEEQYGSLGPRGYLGLRRCDRIYPEKFSIDSEGDRYRESPGSSDDSFELQALSYKEEDRTAPRLESSPEDSPEINKPKIRVPQEEPPTQQDNRAKTNTTQKLLEALRLNEVLKKRDASGLLPTSKPRVSRRLSDLLRK